jgi:hypothetical protein
VEISQPGVVAPFISKADRLSQDIHPELVRLAVRSSDTISVISRCVDRTGGVDSLQLCAPLYLREPFPLFHLPCSLELGRLLLVLAPLELGRLLLALPHLDLALLFSNLCIPALILDLLGACLSGTGLVELSPLNVRRAASGVAVVRTALNRRRSNLRALILPVVMIVLPVLRLGRCGHEKERRRAPKYLSALHRSSIRSSTTTLNTPGRAACASAASTNRTK